MKTKLSGLDLSGELCLRVDLLTSSYREELEMFIEELGLVPKSMVSPRDIDSIASHIAEDDDCLSSWMFPDSSVSYELNRLRELAKIRRQQRKLCPDATLFDNYSMRGERKD